ncbi:MAG: glycosyltransferase family 4 protein [Candidatus Sericytochromatia bacterium]
MSRQIAWLRERFDVTAAGFDAAAIEGVNCVELTPPPVRGGLRRKLGRIATFYLGGADRFYWTNHRILHACEQLQDRHFDLVIANDLEALPLGRRLAKQGRLLLDAHEYAPREYENFWTWRLINQPYVTRLCRLYLSQADAMTTICEGIAEEYARVFGIPKPGVITNAPAYLAELKPTPVDPGRIRIIHHGLAAPNRRLELMIELMDRLDSRFELDLMLVTFNQNYLAGLKAAAAHQPRIRFREPVPLPEIVPVLNAYDIGLFLLPPLSFNSLMTLPNKFFEFVQARLATVIGPSPEMARLVKHYDCGLIAPDFEPASMAELLNRLTPEQLSAYKLQSHRAAAELCAETNAEALLALVESLIHPH